MGLNVTGDEYNRRGDVAIDGLQNVVKVVDDILVYDEDYDARVVRVRQLLESYRKHQITPSSGRAKFNFAAPQVQWESLPTQRDDHQIPSTN